MDTLHSYIFLLFSSSSLLQGISCISTICWLDMNFSFFGGVFFWWLAASLPPFPAYTRAFNEESMMVTVGKMWLKVIIA